MKRFDTRLRAPALGAILMLCGACGGDSPTEPQGSTGGQQPLSFDDFQAASLVIGQPDMASRERDAGGTTNPVGLAVPYGRPGVGARVYIPDRANNRVLGFNALPSANGPSADFVMGQPDFTSNTPGRTATAFDGPMSCVVAGGRLFLADRMNSRVLIWNNLPDGNVDADVVLGQPDFTSNDNDPLSASELGLPRDLWVAGGRLFVLDGIRRVLIWNSIPTTNEQPADVVVGQPDFTSGERGVSATRFDIATALWADANRLVVADWGASRILIFTPIPTTNGAAASVVVGQPDLTSSGSSGPSATAFAGPEGVASDGTSLFVADTGAARVLIFDFPTSNGAAATGVLGQTNFTLGTANDPNQDGVSDNVASARTFGAVSSLTVFGSQLFASDPSNHRVVVIDSK